MESIIIASNKDAYLRALMQAAKGTRAERYHIQNGKTFYNPAHIASGIQLMNHEAYTAARILHESNERSLCIGIQDGIIKMLNRLFLLTGIVFILPDATEIITHTPAVELKDSTLTPQASDTQTYYFRWSQLTDPEVHQESYFAHSSNGMRIEALAAGFKLAINQINWNKFPSSPPQPLQSTSQ